MRARAQHLHPHPRAVSLGETKHRRQPRKTLRNLRIVCSAVWVAAPRPPRPPQSPQDSALVPHPLLNQLPHNLRRVQRHPSAWAEAWLPRLPLERPPVASFQARAPVQRPPLEPAPRQPAAQLLQPRRRARHCFLVLEAEVPHQLRPVQEPHQELPRVCSTSPQPVRDSHQPLLPLLKLHLPLEAPVRLQEAMRPRADWLPLLLGPHHQRNRG
jgi:hypothetical protein